MSSDPSACFDIEKFPNDIVQGSASGDLSIYTSSPTQAILVTTNPLFGHALKLTQSSLEVNSNLCVNFKSVVTIGSNNNTVSGLDISTYINNNAISIGNVPIIDKDCSASLSNATLTGALTANGTSTFSNIMVNGYLGVGKADPSYQLDLSTDDARKLTTTTWSTGSDSRVKRNVVNANTSVCYDNFKSLPLKYFEWDSNIMPDVDDRRMLGWIAQDVASIFPKSVSSSENYGISDFKCLNVDQLYKTMYGALTKCIEKIELLESKNEQLQSDVDILKEQLSNKL